MAETDPIAKTMCVVLTVATVFVIVLLVVAKNNPAFAQTFFNLIHTVADTITGYSPNTFTGAAGLYALADQAGPGTTAKDPYTLDIQNRAETVNNAVLGVVDAQKTQPDYKFRTTCEDALFLIRKQNLEAEQENLKLTPKQRLLNVKYLVFLSEAYNVVFACSQGQKPDLSRMNEAKRYITS